MTDTIETLAAGGAANALERLDRRLAVIRDRVRAVSDGDAPGLYLYGRPGTGKTRTVRRTLHALEARETYHAGHLTPLGLFDLMAAHPDGVLVLDDVGELLRQRVAVQLLLAALGGQSGGDGRRVVSYRRQGVEERVEFAGGVVLISNLTLHPAGLLAALQSRVEAVEFDPPDDELEALMVDLVATGWAPDGTPRLTPGQAREAVGHLAAEARRRGVRLDLRLLDKALRAYARWLEGKTETHWKDLVAVSVGRHAGEAEHTPLRPVSRAARKEAEQSLVRSLVAETPGDRNRQIAGWERRTGKSGRAFYRRLGEVSPPGGFPPALVDVPPPAGAG